MEQQMVAGRDSAGRLLGVAAWTNTAAAGIRSGRPRSIAALKDTVLDKTRSRSLAATSPLPPMPSRKTAAAARWRRWRPCPGVRLVNDQTRLVPEAKPFVWSAERDVARVTLGGSAPLPASKGQAAGGGARRARRRRGRRSDESVARRAAAFRQCRAVADRSDRQIEGRQDHDFRHQGQPCPAWRATSAAAKRSRPR